RPRRSDRALALERLRRPAGLARIPQLLEALDVLLAKLAFELPIAQRLADDLACGGVLAGLDGRPKGGDLLAGQGDTDFLNIGHWISGGSPLDRKLYHERIVRRSAPRGARPAPR